MPVLKLPKIFSTDFSIPDRNPIDPVEINWDWEMTRGLATLNVSPNLEKDLVHPNTVFSSDSPAPFVDQIGHGRNFNGSSNFIRNTTTVPSDYPFTFFASFSNAGSVFGGIVGIGGSGSSTHRTALTATGTNMLMMRAQTFGGNNSEINITYDGSEPVTHIVGVYNSAIDRKFFVNGQLRGTATSSVPGNVFNRFTLGRWDDSSPGQHFGGVMYIAGHFQRTMSEAEALSLSKNVFQLLRPTSPPAYFFPGVAAVTGALTGTAAPTITETDIVDGGKTVIVTLTGDTFVTGSTSEDGIAGGSDSDKTGANKWDALVKTALDNTDVVLSGGNTVATITLPAFGTYDTDETETITWTIPAASLTTSTSDIIVTPTFNVTAVAVGLPIPVAMFNYRRRR